MRYRIKEGKMTYLLDEFRDKAVSKKLIHEIRNAVSEMKISSPLTLMELCGGQTHELLKSGIQTALYGVIEFIHGPGCPVCVTPIETIDFAIALAKKPNVIFASLGDMFRVPGSAETMFEARAKGADIKVVSSPMEAVTIAEQNPKREVVFFGIGFETTTPPIVVALDYAINCGIQNFSILTAMVKVPPALELILQDPQSTIKGILAAGHVCTVMGIEEYIPLAEKYSIPIVITGFEPVDLLYGILACVKQIRDERHVVENPYDRIVRLKGNMVAKDLMFQYLEVIDRNWRGIGYIEKSGFGIRPEFANYDAEVKHGDVFPTTSTEAISYCGQVLMGHLKPNACPYFGKSCTTIHPLGAPMVSSEGACAAYINYGTKQTGEEL